MYTDVNYNQFEFQEVKDKLIIVTFKPITSRFSKLQRNVVIMHGNRFYDLAKKCEMKLHNWVELNYLATFVQNYDGQVINSI